MSGSIIGRMARELARLLPAARTRQLLVDVSAVSRTDLRTGIERVVRAQLLELMRHPPAGFSVQPVRLGDETRAWRYHYADAYARTLDPAAAVPGGIVTPRAGDIFYGPDMFPDGVMEAARAGLYADWRARGVKVNFLIHDILPVLRPEFFPEGADRVHAKWLDCVSREADRLICISQSVADEVRAWLAAHGNAAGAPIAVLRHGADIAASHPSQGKPADAPRVLARLAAVPSFLMVGTIEPRKGHLQAIAAFERLWHEGLDVNLVVVGKEGWKPLPDNQRRTIPQIVAALASHPEAGRRLFWLQGASDEYLDEVYSACACLVFASEGEGFGLPLIEAAQHGLPIIVRDLPVFREVAGDHALYFSGTAPGDLAAAVRQWLALREQGRVPSPAGIRSRTWAENAAELAAILTAD